MNNSKNHVVIFGASVGGVKVAKTFRNLEIEFDFFVDNDVNKIGKIIEGKLVQEPAALLNSGIDYTIIIASMFYKEIKDQLLQMGVQERQIKPKEDFILSYFEEQYKDILTEKKLISEHKNHRFLMDMTEGIRITGAEKWALTVTEALNKQGDSVTVLTTNDNTNSPVSNEIDIMKFDIDYDTYKEAVVDLVNYLESQLPCTVILNRISQLYMAAHLIKKMYGNRIKIISVIHGDFVRLYEQNALLSDTVDFYLCVSKEIQTNFNRLNKLYENKVYFKNSPIPFEGNLNKNYSNRSQPIVIGYGARLEVAQKRADLIIPLILNLEDQGLNYRLNIAGGGSCFIMLRDFIKERGLENKIMLYGELPFEQMNQFWKDSDIFINVSDSEGTSISMLEAMSAGAVPIVTDTSGVRNFVNHGENGYIVKLGDMKSMADFIGLLDNNRDELKLFGSRAREIIRKECNMKEYAVYLSDLIHPTGN